MRRKDGFSGEQVIVLPRMAVDMERADPLVSSLYITDIGYYPKAIGHYRERSVPIPQWVLIYCVEGSGWYRVDGTTRPIGAGQYVILPAGKPHAYASDTENPWTIYWVHFRGDHAGVYAEGAQTPHDVKPSPTSRISERRELFEEMLATLRDGYGLENLRYASSLLHHYLASMRYIALFRHVGQRAPAEDVVGAAIHYMRENAERRLMLQDLANYTGFSPNHFSALFRQQTGLSPMSYFNRLKMELACRLLTTTDMQIKQICHKVGIDDSYYFSRIFAKTIGSSPSAYRLKHKGEGEKR